MHRRLPSIIEGTSGWYQGWYFDLRLEEEASRSARYGLSFSVVVCFLPESEDRKHGRRLLNELLSDIAARKLRRSDIPAILALDEFAVLLPHTSVSHAEVVAERLAKWFQPFEVGVGMAGFPEEGKEPDQLLMIAEQRAAESMRRFRTGSEAFDNFDPVLMTRLPAI